MRVEQNGIIFDDDEEAERICSVFGWTKVYDVKNRIGLLSCGLPFRIARDLRTSQ
jgi:hypothetical protein